MASQFGTAWEELVNFDHLRSYRAKRIEIALEANNLDGLMVFKHDNIRYLAGYRPLMWETGYVTRNAALYARGGRPIVLAHAGDLSRAKAGMPWMKGDELQGLGSMEDPGIAKTIVEENVRELISGLGLASGRIGLDATTFFTTGYLRSAIDQADWLDGDACMKTARAIKSDDEIKLIAIASQIVTGGLWAALQLVDNDGITEQRVSAAGIQAIFRQGAEYLPFSPIVTLGGPSGATYYPMASERILTPGSLVIMDFGAIHDGYCARVARTTTVGRPNDAQRDLYRSVHAALQSGLTELQPGTPATKVVEAMRRSLPDSEAGGLIYAGGCGAGLGLDDLPRLQQDSPDVIEVGNVIALEAGAHVPGVGGVRLCDTVAVTDSGPKVLTTLDHDQGLAAD